MLTGELAAEDYEEGERLRLIHEQAFLVNKKGKV